MGYPPRKFIEEWANKHPVLAALQTLVWLAIVSYALWFMTDGCQHLP